MPTKKEELTPEEMQAELQAELEAAKAEIEALATETAALRKKASPSDNTGKVIRGHVEVELETPEGQKQKKKLRYKPGRVKTRLPDGLLVDSQAFMDLATGKALDAETLKANPALARWTKAKALAQFQTWAEKRVALFELS